MGSTFVKAGSAEPQGAIEAEAAGLAWLAEAESSGGTRIVVVLGHDTTTLTEERLEHRSPSPKDAESLGRSLAATHAAGAPGWGWAPTAPRTFIAALPLVTHTGAADDPFPQTWGQFYAQDRLVAVARRARDNGALTTDEARTIERLAARVADGAFDARQPRGCPDVARLHGDLWNGNVLWTGGPTGATLIDPSAHGGHAETDLAMLALFGAPHLDWILAAYDEAAPLADGWRDRVELHQVYPLLVHAALFGPSWGHGAARAARRYA